MNIAKVIIPAWVKYLVLAAIVAAYSFFWYNQGYKNRDRQALQEQVKAQQLAEKKRQETQKRLDDVSNRLQKALENVRVETHYIDRVITKEIEKPVYKNCVVPDTGSAVLNDNAERLNRLRK